MTKAEMLERSRWVVLVLPPIAAGGFRLYRSIMQPVLSRSPASTVETGLAFLFQISAFVPAAWVFLTIVCAAWAAYTLKAEAKIGGTRGLVFLSVMTALIFVLQVIPAVVLFQILPLL